MRYIAGDTRTESVRSHVNTKTKSMKQEKNTFCIRRENILQLTLVVSIRRDDYRRRFHSRSRRGSITIVTFDRARDRAGNLRTDQARSNGQAMAQVTMIPVFPRARVVVRLSAIGLAIAWHLGKCKHVLASGEQTGAFDQGIRLRGRSVR